MKKCIAWFVAVLLITLCVMNDDSIRADIDEVLIFGNNTDTDSTYDIDDIQRFCGPFSPTYDGFLDSLTGLVNITGTTRQLRMAVYVYEAGIARLVDQTALLTPSAGKQWISAVTQNQAQIWSDSLYVLVAWGSSDDATALFHYFPGCATGDTIKAVSRSMDGWLAEVTGLTGGVCRSGEIYASYTCCAVPTGTNIYYLGNRSAGSGLYSCGNRLLGAMWQACDSGRVESLLIRNRKVGGSPKFRIALWDRSADTANAFRIVDSVGGEYAHQASCLWSGNSVVAHDTIIYGHEYLVGVWANGGYVCQGTGVYGDSAWWATLTYSVTTALPDIENATPSVGTLNAIIVYSVTLPSGEVVYRRRRIGG